MTRNYQSGGRYWIYWIRPSAGYFACLQELTLLPDIFTTWCPSAVYWSSHKNIRRQIIIGYRTGAAYHTSLLDMVFPLEGIILPYSGTASAPFAGDWCSQKKEQYYSLAVLHIPACSTSMLQRSKTTLRWLKVVSILARWSQVDMCLTNGHHNTFPYFYIFIKYFRLN